MLKLTTDKQEASRGLSAIAELLVLIYWNNAKITKFSTVENDANVTNVISVLFFLVTLSFIFIACYDTDTS